MKKFEASIHVPTNPSSPWQVRHEAAQLAERLEKLNQARIGDTEDSEILQETNGHVAISMLI